MTDSTPTRPASSAWSPSPLLSMRGISKRFGATQALRNVSLDVFPGSVTALVGENGAGKSTLMKILSGAHAPDQGTIVLDGRPYRPATPHEGRTAGVAMIYQELTLAPDLNVVENVLLGQDRHRAGLLRLGDERRVVAEALATLGHGDLPLDRPVRTLSTAQQQLIEIARALVSRAKIVVFDEPTSSLTQHDARRLFDVIRTMKRRGLGIIYISHFLEEIRETADRYSVLRDGETVGDGVLQDVDESRLVSLMVGRNVGELFPTVPHTPGDVLLEATGLQADDGTRFYLRRGEILGLAGLVGAGRTELLRTLAALDPVRSGRVRVAGITIAQRPRARLRAGLGLVSEDRKHEGLAQSLSIEENITLSRLAPYSTAGVLNLRRRREAARACMQRLQVKARGPEQIVGELSGGNQQKVALARVLHQQADVLLLDEPTRGIDVGTKAEIYRLMGELAAAGKAILFVSSYLPELPAVCDRIGVMSRGRLREVRPAKAWTEESIMACAVAGDEAMLKGAR
jgi:ribose transport system ATP-binding protein